MTLGRAWLTPDTSSPFERVHPPENTTSTHSEDDSRHSEAKGTAEEASRDPETMATQCGTL